MPPTLTTARLILRGWTEADRDRLAEMQADPKGTAMLMGPFPRQESDAFFDRIQAHWATHGFGLWAVELPGVAPLIGAVGLMRPRFELHFTPAVEVGWRLAPEYWGNGYATEAARASLDYAFSVLALEEIVSFTAATNEPSRRVMERLGMKCNPADDFDHPRVPEGHALRPHVLYRIGASQWASLQA